MLQFIDSTELLQSQDASGLRARADEEGYLFFKRLLPAQDILSLRAEMLAVVDGYGWRRPGQDEYGGLIDTETINQVPEDQMRTDIGVSNSAYESVQKLERFHRLPHHPRLIAFYRLLFGQDVFVHPRHIARMVTSHRAMVPTPPHQDFPLIQGSTNTWTCWFPLGNCPAALGGLAVLRASQRKGCLPVGQSTGAGGITAHLCPGEDEWVSGSYDVGDVLTFPSYTVHKAQPCQTKDQIRLSLDVRYQPTDEVVEEKSLSPHCALTWEQVYAEWQQDDLKYYWRSLPLFLSPWDDSLMQPTRRIC